MPILESNGQRTATLRLVVATGLGAIFGLQNWRLARYGFAISGPLVLVGVDDIQPRDARIQRLRHPRIYTVVEARVGTGSGLRHPSRSGHACAGVEVGTLLLRRDGSHSGSRTSHRLGLGCALPAHPNGDLWTYFPIGRH